MVDVRVIPVVPPGRGGADGKVDGDDKSPFLGCESACRSSATIGRWQNPRVLVFSHHSATTH